MTELTVGCYGAITTKTGIVRIVKITHVSACKRYCRYSYGFSGTKTSLAKTSDIEYRTFGGQPVKPPSE